MEIYELVDINEADDKYSYVDLYLLPWFHEGERCGQIPYPSHSESQSDKKRVYNFAIWRLKMPPSLKVK